MIETPDASVLLKVVLPGNDEQDTGRDAAVVGTIRVNRHRRGSSAYGQACRPRLSHITRNTCGQSIRLSCFSDLPKSSRQGCLSTNVLYRFCSR